VLREAAIAALFVPLVVWLLARRNGAPRLFRCALVSFGLIWLLVVGSAFAHGRYLHAQLYAFDTNGDEIFSGAEQSPEQQRALDRVTNDLSRTLALFGAAFFARAWNHRRARPGTSAGSISP